MPSLDDTQAVREVTSNVRRADYVGSHECKMCHGDIYASWAASPMRNMTRLFEPSLSRAPLDGSIFRFANDSVRTESHGEKRFMRLVGGDGSEKLYRLTKVIGGRIREDFVGIEVATHSAPETAPTIGDERIMPVSWIIDAKEWRYKGYSVMNTERTRLAPGVVWRKTCIFCHNTVPWLSTQYDELNGGLGSYQGRISDRFLPPSRTWKTAIVDDTKLRVALSDEVLFLQGVRFDPATTPTAELVDDVIRATRRKFDTKHLVEVGIGCEACHLGAAQHIADETMLPVFEPRGAGVALQTPDGRPASRPALINRACARCHTVLFTKYGHTWEGGKRTRNGGGSNMNSGEARNFLLGGCSNDMSCVHCHDPHARDAPARLDMLATVAGNSSCTGCHTELSTASQLAAHSHHAADKPGPACVGCHMPEKNMGIDYQLTRYHRIGSPTDRERVERDRPLECALCHADKSVTELVGTMETWWSVKYDRVKLRELYGDNLELGVLDLTIERGKPHEQVVAAIKLAQSGQRAKLPLIAQLVSHPIPLIRFFVAPAIERMVGVPLDIDLHGSQSAIRTQMSVWLEKNAN